MHSYLLMGICFKLYEKNIYSVSKVEFSYKLSRCADIKTKVLAIFC